MKRIIYYSILKLPSRMANAVHIMKVCQSFQSLGHRVTLIAQSKGREEEIFEEYAVRHRFEISDSPMPSVRLKPLRMVGWFFFLLGARAAVKERHPHLVYSRDVFSSVFFDGLDIPIIYECHEDPISPLKRFFLKRTLECQNVKLVVTISQKLEQILSEKYAPYLRGKKIVAAPDGVDTGAYRRLESESKGEIRRRLGLVENQYTVGYTGSLFRGRGIDIIIEAARRLKQFAFVVVGGAPEEVAPLKKKAEERGIRNLTFVGHVPHRLIPDYLSACDILLMPYQERVTLKGNKRDTSRYMSPLKMFEYMASGTPIVSSDLPVLKEILRHGENALLVRPGAVEAWCRAIETLETDPSLAEAVSRRARGDVSGFDWDTRVKKILRALPGTGWVIRGVDHEG